MVSSQGFVPVARAYVECSLPSWTWLKSEELLPLYCHLAQLLGVLDQDHLFNYPLFLTEPSTLKQNALIATASQTLTQQIRPQRLVAADRTSGT